MNTQSANLAPGINFAASHSWRSRSRLKFLCSTVGHDHGTKELRTFPLSIRVWAAAFFLHVIPCYLPFERKGTNHARGTPNSSSCKSLSPLVMPLRNAKNAKNAKTCQGIPKKYWVPRLCIFCTWTSHSTSSIILVPETHATIHNPKP